MGGDNVEGSRLTVFGVQTEGKDSPGGAGGEMFVLAGRAGGPPLDAPGGARGRERGRRAPEGWGLSGDAELRDERASDVRISGQRSASEVDGAGERSGDDRGVGPGGR